jgi:periplasmic divalent cation tolerance protein
MNRQQGKYGVLFTTVASKADASKIAKMLLDEKLAACVQVIPIESYYTWKGETSKGPELLLLIKTTASLFEVAIAFIKKHHPYETPEIVATDFAAGYSGYFSWIEEVTRK